MLDFSKIKTYSVKNRTHKEKLAKFPDVNDPIEIMDDKQLSELAERIVAAFKNGKQVIFMMGGHVIKTGMAPFIIDLMKRGIIKHIATNGSTSIHDFEIATIGETSEDVEAGIKNGSFGMVDETGRLMNEAINEGALKDLGYGFSIGKKINDLNSDNKNNSVFYNAYKLEIPISVHVAIGNDTIHQHPRCDGSLLGKATYSDFKLLADSIGKMRDGVVVNIGSAVVLPETFLKALTIARNLGCNVENITAANLDMNDHYRPRVNIVERPVKALGGRGLVIIGRHEKTIPSLYKLIISKLTHHLE